MAFSTGRSSVNLDDILNRVTEGDILSFYLDIQEIPIIINSPLRQDRHPSFGLYSKDGVKISYIDLSTRDSGGTFDLLGKLWGCDFKKVLERVEEDIPKMKLGTSVKEYHCKVKSTSSYHEESDLQCKTRDWQQCDVDYWGKYGISIDWLKYAEVYPISHKIIIKENKKYVLGADKLAYAYVEHKEGKVTLKIYQPLNKNGYKWSNKHDSSVVSLWTKVPKEGKAVCICSSLKDALCLWANTGIPSLAIQGEGYKMSDTAINELKRRFEKVFILLDNDEPGIKDAEKLAQETGFINIVLPKFNEGKDISDLYCSLQDKEKFNKLILGLFNKHFKN